MRTFPAFAKGHDFVTVTIDLQVCAMLSWTDQRDALKLWVVAKARFRVVEDFRELSDGTLCWAILHQMYGIVFMLARLVGVLTPTLLSMSLTPTKPKLPAVLLGRHPAQPHPLRERRDAPAIPAGVVRVHVSHSGGGIPPGVFNYSHDRHRGGRNARGGDRRGQHLQVMLRLRGPVGQRRRRLYILLRRTGEISGDSTRACTC